MKKHLFSILLFVVYFIALIKIMVFKDVPLIRVGSIMLNFGGTDASRPANIIPFKTIIPYLLGDKGFLIAGINLIGNVALLVPLGFLLPLVFRSITWKKSLAIAITSGLVIEIMQGILHVGIFDIDDVILNAFGVMLGCFAYMTLTKWMKAGKYKNIIITIVSLIILTGAAFLALFPLGQHPVNSGMGAGGSQLDRSSNKQENKTPSHGDLCGGTGGNGQITAINSKSFTIKKNDGQSLTVHLADQAKIQTLSGSVFLSDVKKGERVTLVGGPNSDGSFTADTVVVCSPKTP